MLGLADVARETSPALVRGLREAGVRPVVLTGDHPQTAHAIAVDLGWPEDAVVVTGDEIAAADRTARSRMLRDADVVARVAPEQKLQVVESMRDAGRVVGMVGDGANDAAAIRAADIGVGISARGSAAARNLPRTWSSRATTCWSWWRRCGRAGRCGTASPTPSPS